MITVVLGTDMKLHLNTVSIFNIKLALAGATPLNQDLGFVESRQRDSLLHTRSSVFNKNAGSGGSRIGTSVRTSDASHTQYSRISSRSSMRIRRTGTDLHLSSHGFHLKRAQSSQIFPSPAAEGTHSGTGDSSGDHLPCLHPTTLSGMSTVTSAVDNGEGGSDSLLSKMVMDDELRILVWKMAMKCADLGHLASSEETHLKWVGLLEEEMFRQGDMEKAKGYPVSALMDRDHSGITRSQPGFFDMIVLPLFSSLALALPGMRPMLDQVRRNHAYWLAREEM